MRIIALISAVIIITSCETASDYQNKIDQETEDSYSKTQSRIKEMTDSFMSIPRKIPNVKDYVTIVKESELKTSLLNIQETLKSGFNDSYFDGSLENIIIGVSTFYNWGSIVNKGFSDSDIETKNLAIKLRDEIIKTQVKEFPVLRDRYAKQMARDLWEKDFYSWTKGNKNERIIFIHESFTRNKDIKDFKNNFNQNIIDLRFKKEIYNWCKGCGGSQKIEVNSYEDNIIAFYN